MTDIKDIAEELVNLSVKEVQELATILKNDYGEPVASVKIIASENCPLSPRDYGIKLLSKKRRK